MKKNTQAYSIIVVIILIGFMILLTTGVFRLVLNEMKDNGSIGNYAKAYIGAESAQELALLQIKEKGYGFNEGLNVSEMLSNSGDNQMQKLSINYSNNGAVNEYKGKIESLKYNIMPLFTIIEDSETIKEEKITDITLKVNNNLSDLSWNIVGKQSGISGTGDETTQGNQKSVNSFGKIIHTPDVTINTFLSASDTNYLILFNNSDTDITYTIKSSQLFTKPILNIISTATIGEYKQNLKTEINYADVVNKANYSIYSGG